MVFQALSKDEWQILKDILLTQRIKSSNAFYAANACLYKYTHRHSTVRRSFGWNELPESFNISGSAVNRYFRTWCENKSWFKFWDALLVMRYGHIKPEKSSTKLAKFDATHAITLETLRAYRYFNKRFLAGTLPNEICVSFETNFNPRALGCTYYNEIWFTETKSTYHIAFNASALNREFEYVLGTLLHEMAHLHNNSLDISDTNSKTQYHT